MARLSREVLLQKIRSFPYWHYEFDLGNGVVIHPTKGEKQVKKKNDLRSFLWPVVLERCGGSLAGLRVLDVACNAGFWSLEAHRSGAARVLGIDARRENVEEALLVRDALEIDPQRLDYRQMNIYDLTPEVVGEYDLVLLFRILHHLSHPLWALERIREVCRRYLVIDIKLALHDEAVLCLGSPNPRDPRSGVGQGLRLQPSRSALELMLGSTGFTNVTGASPKPPLQEDYFKGRRAVFTAEVLADS